MNNPKAIFDSLHEVEELVFRAAVGLKLESMLVDGGALGVVRTLNDPDRSADPYTVTCRFLTSRGLVVPYRTPIVDCAEHPLDVPELAEKIVATLCAFAEQVTDLEGAFFALEAHVANVFADSRRNGLEVRTVALSPIALTDDYLRCPRSGFTLQTSMLNEDLVPWGYEMDLENEDDFDSYFEEVVLPEQAERAARLRGASRLGMAAND